MGNKQSQSRNSTKRVPINRPDDSDDDDDICNDNIHLEVETYKCLNGQSEAEVINLLINDCKSDHQKYTLVENLFGNIDKQASLQLLPEAIRHESVLEFIKIHEKLVVRVRTSVRGETGKKCSYGTGYVSLSSDKLMKYRQCHLRNCRYNQGQVHENYGGLIVYTNKHVIENNLEAGCCNIDFFYYNAKSLVDVDEMTHDGSSKVESGAKINSSAEIDNREQPDISGSELESGAKIRSSNEIDNSEQPDISGSRLESGLKIRSSNEIDNSEQPDISGSQLESGAKIRSSNEIDNSEQPDISGSRLESGLKICSSNEIDNIKMPNMGCCQLDCNDNINSTAKDCKTEMIDKEMCKLGSGHGISSSAEISHEITAAGSFQLLSGSCVNSSPVVDTSEHKFGHNDEIHKNNYNTGHYINGNGLHNGVTAYGFVLREEQKNKDLVGLRIFYHDPELFNLIKTLRNLRMNAWSKIPEEIKRKMTKYAIIISHPHGLPKRISFGNLISLEETSRSQKGFKVTMYNATTCGGSSGAPVVTGYYSYRPFVHSSKDEQNMLGLSYSY